MTMTAYVIVTAVIRRGAEVLLVRHDTEFGSPPYWTLPGGTADPGENAFDAVIREVQEETGMTVSRLGKLAYVTQHLNHKRGWQSDVFCFEVDEIGGQVAIENDPDKEILDVGYFPVAEAAALLADCPFLVIGLPASHHLRSPPGSPVPFWIFKEGEDGRVETVGYPEQHRGDGTA